MKISVSLLLKKTSRLTNSKDFKKIINPLNLKQKRSGVCWYCRPNDAGYPRIGIITPKRAVNRAADRNRYRRIIREIFRLNQNMFGGVDIVALVRSDNRLISDFWTMNGELLNLSKILM